MPPRPRKPKHRGLEPNLYRNGDYYVYRHPVTGHRRSFGKDKGRAQAAARVLNARLMTGADLVARVMGEDGITLGRAIEAWLAERVDPHSRHSASTKQNKHYRSGRIRKDRGDTLLSRIDTRWCASYLDENFTGDSYAQYRAILSQVFAFAQTKGWMTSNPITPTRKSDEGYTKQRRRLTVDQYRAIYDMAPPWFQVAMELALLCLFGRYEVCAARYDHIFDGALHYVREKTRNRSKTAYVAIEMTPPLEELIQRSRQLMPVSPFIIHRQPQRIGDAELAREHWSKVTPDYISRQFADLRDKVPTIAALPRAARPTFHEIRSLGSRLLELKGVPVTDIQVLMGHADEDMTQHYLDGHGTRWQKSGGNIYDMGALLAQKSPG